MQQSIVPVVAWLEGEHAMRCIGTASIISCTGYLLTAAHVVMDPIEAGYGAVRDGVQVRMQDNLNFGVLIPFWGPSQGMTMQKAFRFFPMKTIAGNTFLISQFARYQRCPTVDRINL